MQPVAVVTGASSGIGAATAIKLAEARTGDGYHVVLTARRAGRIEAVAARIHAEGGSAQAHVLDVTDRAAVDAFAASLDRCDVLVNNAGGAVGAEPVAPAEPADSRATHVGNPPRPRSPDGRFWSG